MHLFVLTPINPKWPTNVFKKIESIIVRAQSEHDARELVKRVTFISPKTKIGIQVHNPWQNPAFSKCERYQGNDHPVDGTEAILAPATLADYFLKIKK